MKFDFLLHEFERMVLRHKRLTLGVRIAGIFMVRSMGQKGESPFSSPFIMSDANDTPMTVQYDAKKTAPPLFAESR
jgi:hypothetical protein